VLKGAATSNLEWSVFRYGLSVTINLFQIRVSLVQAGGARRHNFVAFNAGDEKIYLAHCFSTGRGQCVLGSELGHGSIL
jgi:hypothetical protein